MWLRIFHFKGYKLGFSVKKKISIKTKDFSEKAYIILVQKVEKEIFFNLINQYFHQILAKKNFL